MPMARDLPARLGRLQVEPKSGTIPRRGPKVATKNDDLTAMVTSHAKASPIPPPAATPFTLATVGTGQL